MKRFIQRISLPVLLFAGLMLIGTQTADAGSLHRHARRAYVPRHYYAAPAVVYAPPVRVYAPPVRVYAPPVRVYAPPVRVYTPPVRVYTPGLRVHVGPWIPSHYGRSYFYGW